MKVDPYLHAVLVLHGAGKDISKESLMGVLKAAGITPDEARAKVLSEAVKDANFEELLKAAPVAQAAPVAEAPKEKKEEKKETEEKKEEAAAEGLASLFG
jgi:large subunit ribosomal protein L12